EGAGDRAGVGQRRGGEIAAETDTEAVGISAAEFAGAFDRAAVDDGRCQVAAIFFAIESGALKEDAARDAGDRPGIVHRPTAGEDHTEALAVDLAALLIDDGGAEILLRLIGEGVHRDTVGERRARAADRATVGDSAAADQ